MDNLAKTSRKRFYLTVLLISISVLAVLAVILLLLSKQYISDHSSPWFGRGAKLKTFPYRVIVGPVDADRGIPGVLELGMRHRDVRFYLGPPLVKGLKSEEAEQKGFIDPEDVSADFFDGVFAWVHFDNEEKVMSIEFSLQGFAQKFHGEQRVLLRYKGETFLLIPHLSQGNAVIMFRSKLAAQDIRVQGSTLLLNGSGTSLLFDQEDGTLRSVWISVR
ncbi:MAG: hypothetical protein ACYC7E_08755 [Armatimonadota bacterium]